MLNLNVKKDSEALRIYHEGEVLHVWIDPNANSAGHSQVQLAVAGPKSFAVDRVPKPPRPRKEAPHAGA